MKLGKQILLAGIVVTLAASCNKNSYQAGYNPYRDGNPSSISPGSTTPDGGTVTAADILRNTDVGDDFYRTEEEMWEEHEDNLRRVERKYRRIARLKRKPQYSNPEYYGHRRKPKIRPVGKRRFCKECGIVH
ncbi:MAG TPA: hypothetical protein DCE41_33130 [Cytophagales bacterium]|nr:hypothetical protein [Cytophagales bacterium]HAA19834.1 hypothetical protein [Cytophagales bacterium]HAP63772.1 hypothetical protein [Cytophagales bacterium]